MNNPTQSVPLQNIGRYEVRGELGHGAMGIVYKAIDPNIGRTVALKTMRMDVNAFDHDELLRRFKNEARAAGALNHPNIVTIYDADEANGLFYIAMEFLEGRTLESILAENRMLPVERVIEIARQIVSGLDYAHGMNVIHRDIKPANILITRQGLVKIMDFGIAKAGSTMATSASSVLGTPNYMSPEQVRGRSIDGRSDLFSLGVILYQMITGERPFAGENVTTVIYKIVNEEPVAPRDIDVSIHPGLNAVVNKCLAKEPNERYQNGAALMRELENYKTLTADENATTAFSVEDATRAANSAPPSGAATTINRAAAQNAAGVNAGALGNSRFIGNPPLPPRSPVPAVRPPVQPMGTLPLKMKEAPLKQHQKIQETVYSGKLLSIKSWILLIMFLLVALGAVGYQFLPESQRTSISSTVDSWWQALTGKLHHVSESGTAAPAASQKTPTGRVIPVASPAASDDSDDDTAKSTKTSKEAVGKLGEVELTSRPVTSVAVVVDGRDDSECFTHCVVKGLKPGPHQFVFALAGYNTETRKIDVKPGTMMYTIDMTPSGATLLVTSVPHDAAINLDGKDTGQTTPHSFSVAPGSHTVILTRPDFEAAQRSTTVQAGQMVNLPVQLPLADSKSSRNWFGVNKQIPPGKGALNILTNPDGATVIINGVAQKGKSPVRITVPAVDYQISVRADGYKDDARTVHVDEGQQTKVDFELQPK